jgi:two-component system chemotaxis response regulator CheV
MGLNDENILKVGSNEMELVDFRIMKEEVDRIYEGIYGVNVAKIREIIRLPKLTELPGVPDFVEGIFDLRGVVVPVINLAKWMGFIVPAHLKIKPRIIIAEFNNVLVGFIVHEAKRIRRISWKDIEPAGFSGHHSGHGVMDQSKITGVTRIENDEVLLILDLERVVQELGFYEPNIDTEETDSGIEQFEGIALTLDDSSTARKIVAEALKKMGLKVVEANDGEQGLIRLEELYQTYGDKLSEHLKLIISDVEMPKMDGFHFARRIKADKRFAKVPLIFNSSISDHFSDMRGEEVGGDAYLVKFDGNIFYREVSKVLKAHS